MAISPAFFSSSNISSTPSYVSTHVALVSSMGLYLMGSDCLNTRSGYSIRWISVSYGWLYLRHHMLAYYFRFVVDSTFEFLVEVGFG